MMSAVEDILSTLARLYLEGLKSPDEQLTAGSLFIGICRDNTRR